MPTTLTRREFLAGTTAAAAAAAGVAALGFPGGGAGGRFGVAGSNARGGGARGPQRIVVAGAGLAGLSAAFELTVAGHEVTVFEAGSRPGGRVRTVREPFADGLYAEAGAMSIPESHDLPLHYARLFELPLVALPARYGGVTVAHFRGRRLLVGGDERPGWPVELTEEERGLDLGGLRERYWGEELAAAAAADPLGPPPEALRPLDALTLAGLWRRNGASEGAVALMRLSWLDLLGDGAESFSALQAVREAGHRRAGDAFYRIEGGNDRLPQAFAARLGGRVRYGAALVGVAHDRDGVRAAIRDGAGVHEIAADRLICAIPFTVLRDVPIEPALPAGKGAALRELGNTAVTRIFLQCRTRFWEAEGLSGTGRTDLPIMSVHHQTVGLPGPRGILETYAVGREARRLAAMTPAERLQAALDGASRAFPSLPAQFEGGTSIAWSEEPWERGAYVWFKPGQMTTLAPHLAPAEGRIHFAGDHTTWLPGWMQGALASGRRVAAEIGGG